MGTTPASRPITHPATHPATHLSPRTILVRGLLAGLLAGIAAFVVAFTVGEPQVDTAIALEESTSSAASESPADHTHAEGTPAHSHGDGGGAEVSRADQSTWGLATGTLTIGLALGGIVALVSGAAIGRLGRMTPGQSTAVVSLVGFVAFALVPFLKYPATPPAVGSGDTIGQRTAYYFVFLAVSVVAAVGAVALARRLHADHGGYVASVGGAAAYLVVVVVAGALLPSVNEVGDFPADTLWYFRLASLMTLVAMWSVLGVALTGFVGRLHHRQSAVTARRELAASL